MLTTTDAYFPLNQENNIAITGTNVFVTLRAKNCEPVDVFVPEKMNVITYSIVRSDDNFTLWDPSGGAWGQWTNILLHFRPLD